MASPETQSTQKPRRAAAKKTSADSGSTDKTPGSRSRAKKADGSQASSSQQLASPRTLSPEERYRMTEVAAYFIAEHNNFSGNPVEYWQAAESQISRMLEQR